MMLSFEILAWKVREVQVKELNLQNQKPNLRVKVKAVRLRFTWPGLAFHLLNAFASPVVQL